MITLQDNRTARASLEVTISKFLADPDAVLARSILAREGAVLIIQNCNEKWLGLSASGLVWLNFDYIPRQPKSGDPYILTKFKSTSPATAESLVGITSQTSIWYNVVHSLARNENPHVFPLPLFEKHEPNLYINRLIKLPERRSLLARFLQRCGAHPGGDGRGMRA